MKKQKISNKEISILGIKNTKLLILFSTLANTMLKEGKISKGELLMHLKLLANEPERYITEQDSRFKELAAQIIRLRKTGKIPPPVKDIELKQQSPDFPVFGRKNIEEGALTQMNTAMKLPVAVAGALMPDAHQGYGLPIGGVLATNSNTVIPYAVGVDIACRMCLSVFDVPSLTLDTEKEKLTKLLLGHTSFGLGSTSKSYFDTSVLDHPDWNASALLRSLKDKAYAQLGTSGTGNHFVEWGELEVKAAELPGLPEGKYLALLSHSGSRGFGSAVAAYYSKIAMEKTVLPKEARHLAWLSLDSQEGMEYWVAMSLAGLYASANHHEIHSKIARSLNMTPLTRIENHHNFAWKEQLPDGTEVIVHRKGATPAGKGVLGIIPGSMSTPGFVVRGKGESSSLQSASHGAGRLMSRSAAFKTLKKDVVEAELRAKDITLLGSDLDEAPMVYKDIHTVMAAQQELVDVLATFQPRIVRMANPKERPED